MFKYYNVNPFDLHVPDCVCRAISLATDSDYYNIAMLLHRNGANNDCEELCVDCYSRLLADVGYKKIHADGQTVREIAKKYQKQILLIRINGHLTCSLYGVVHDIWDCSDKKADVFWIID